LGEARAFQNTVVADLSAMAETGDKESSATAQAAIGSGQVAINTAQSAIVAAKGLLAVASSPRLRAGIVRGQRHPARTRPAVERDH